MLTTAIHRIQVLLVEDDLEIGKWVDNKLSNLDNINSMHWVTNLEGAYNAIHQNIPDVIILDLKLPDGNGIDFLKKIRQDKIISKVFVFSVNIELAKTCLRYGADKFFDKTMDGEKLIASFI